MFSETIAIIIPKLKKIVKGYQKYCQSKLHSFDEKEFRDLLINVLGIKSSDTVFIHSSLDKINLNFSPFVVLKMLIDIVGPDGTIVFPTYPMGYSYDFLKQGKVFNQKSTPSATGILSEIARRHKDAYRSLHPTKSVVAIGKNAEEITSTHHLSPYPYDTNSPYQKIYQYNAKIIGLGIKSTYLSCVHTVDDSYKEDFVVEVYHKQLFESVCVNSSGNKVIVKTKAHDMDKMVFNLPHFFGKYVDKSICSDLKIMGYNFFSADAYQLFKRMIDLYESENITIYPKRLYKDNQ
jgi:aminoglycoside 3-N-acetyltransferase